MAPWRRCRLSVSSNSMRCLLPPLQGEGRGGDGVVWGEFDFSTYPIPTPNPPLEGEGIQDEPPLEGEGIQDEPPLEGEGVISQRLNAD